jgi:hypothetical protein
MKILFGIVVVMSLSTSLALAADRAAAVPVIVELFTSEGCSSCPTADKLLAQLDREQPIKETQIIPLAFHVDYWNKLGWPDRFSAPAFTQRQYYYAAASRSARVYTPQMIVDGRDEFVGSDSNKAHAAIKAAAARAKLRISIVVKEPENPPASSIELRLAVPESLSLKKDQPVDLLVALTEDDLTSEVSRGENAGRMLHHVAVVRKLEVAASGTGPESLKRENEITLALDKSWDRSKLRVVAFLQDRSSRQILAAGATDATVVR